MAASQTRLSETEPKWFVFEASCYAFGGRIRRFAKVNVNKVNIFFTVYHINSIKHDLNSAGLDTTNAAQMVFDRPQWKAFVSGLPTLEPEQGS